ncbi:hypothetical protein LXL04_016401 [Taraxacum kok-saghyz]
MFNKDFKHDVSKQMFTRWQAILVCFDFVIQYKKEVTIVSQISNQRIFNTSGCIPIAEEAILHIGVVMEEVGEILPQQLQAFLIELDLLQIINLFQYQEATELVEFSHFTSGEWGLSTLKEREFMMPPSKFPVKFTYWDYIESFHKAFLYENPQKKHTWFFKTGGLEVISSLHFFMEFSIPCIWKWSPQVDYTPSTFPSLQRIYFTKFWPKMLRKDPETKVLHAQQTIDHIKQQIQKYQHQKNFNATTSPNTQKVNTTKEDMIKNFRSYCSQLKEDLRRIKSKEMGEEEEDSNEDSISIENNQYHCLAGESQSEEEAIPIEDRIDMFEELVLRKNLSKDKASTSQ